MGEKNEEGERVAYFAMAFDFSVIKTFFWKSQIILRLTRVEEEKVRYTS